jgi:hypothetical protein
MRFPRVEAGTGRIGRCRIVLLATLCGALAACNAGSVMEPVPRVDVGIETAAVAPRIEPEPARNDVAFQPAPQDMPATVPFEMSEGVPLSREDELAAEEAAPGVDVAMAAPVEAQPAFQPPPVVAGPAVVQAAPVQVAQAGGMMSSRDAVLGYPRADMPMASGPGLPADEIACRRELKKLGVTFSDLPPINDGGACRIDYPVKVSILPQKVNLKPAATLTCRMALTVARWTRNELTPAARTRYLSGVRTIHQGSSYSCRNIRTSRKHTPSEHSRGNALDIMRIELNNGRDIDVRKPGFFAFRQKGLLNTVRADACRYFTTVLGPGYDRDHRDHFHLDIMSRRNGYVACR